MSRIVLAMLVYHRHKPTVFVTNTFFEIATLVHVTKRFQNRPTSLQMPT
jgi:hypothetical protein